MVGEFFNGSSPQTRFVLRYERDCDGDIGSTMRNAMRERLDLNYDDSPHAEGFKGTE